jgi:hypothetical protein
MESGKAWLALGLIILEPIFGLLIMFTCLILFKAPVSVFFSGTLWSTMPL